MDFARADRATLQRMLESGMFGALGEQRIRERLKELDAARPPRSKLERRKGKPPGDSGNNFGNIPDDLLLPGEELHLVLYGPPRTKKTHNTIAWRQGKPKVIPSEAWMAWRDALKATGQLPATEEPLPDLPYQCSAIFYRDRDQGDLVGYQQGLADVLEELGVISDDKWIRSWDGSRLDVDRACPRVEITITPIGG